MLLHCDLLYIGEAKHRPGNCLQSNNLNENNTSYSVWITHGLMAWTLHFLLSSNPRSLCSFATRTSSFRLSLLVFTFLILACCYHDSSPSPPDHHPQIYKPWTLLPWLTFPILSSTRFYLAFIWFHRSPTSLRLTIPLTSVYWLSSLYTLSPDAGTQSEMSTIPLLSQT